jgi:hypothetical protein
MVLRSCLAHGQEVRVSHSLFSGESFLGMSDVNHTWIQ